MREYPPETLDPDLAAALQILGVQPVELTPITTLPSQGSARGSFLVRLADGRRIKAALLESASRAGQVAVILDRLRNRHLARVLARHGRALISEWIDGVWPSAPDDHLLEDCGAILGSIHSMRLPPDLVPIAARYREGWSAALSSELDEVVSHGMLDPAIASVAARLAEDAAPVSGDTGFTHRDFCADNLVVDAGGLVHAIDNETMACDALDFDLARWWYRWPMSGGERDSFLRGYARHRSPSAFQHHFHFWMVRALVGSALFRIRGGTGHEDVPISRLAELVRHAAAESAAARAGARGRRGSRVYFASDLHLGAPGALTSRDRERQVIDWLDRVQPEASDIFLLGDLFDFWIEYRTVVPRGHTRVLGRLASLADAGVQLHVFAGNHDRWLGDYLETEVRARIYREPQVMRLNGRMVYLAHGDLLRQRAWTDRLAGSRLVRRVFSAIHPDVGIPIAHGAASRSRGFKSAHGSGLRSAPERQRAATAERRPSSASVEDEELKAVAHQIRIRHPEVEFIVLGHRHRPSLVQFDEDAWCVDVGDWLTHRSFASFDGTTLILRQFEAR